MRLQPLFAVIWTAALMGCTQPMDTKIEASSKEAYEKSIRGIREKLSPEEAKKLDEATQMLVMSELLPNGGGLFGMIAALKDADKLPEKMLGVVNGKTPRELISAADAKTTDRARDELRSVVAEIAEMEKQKTGAENGKETLSKVNVSGAKFYWSGGFLPAPTIELSVTNGTGIALSRLFFHGVVTTPGRSVPWISEDFNYEIPGGIEPGESKQLRLRPNQFSNWGQSETKGRNDLEIVITVVNIANADKKRAAETFDKKDEERLVELIALKANLDKALESK